MKFQVPVTMNYGNKKKICKSSGKLGFGMLNERNFRRRKFVMEFKKLKTEGHKLKPSICHLKVKVSVAHLCPTLCDPMDCSSPGSSVHGLFHTKILEWVAISFFSGSSQPRNRTQVSCITGRFFTVSYQKSPCPSATYCPYLNPPTLGFILICKLGLKIITVLSCNKLKR